MDEQSIGIRLIEADPQDAQQIQSALGAGKTPARDIAERQIGRKAGHA